MQETKANRKYKDRLFRFIFQNKEDLMQQSPICFLSSLIQVFHNPHMYRPCHPVLVFRRIQECRFFPVA